MSNAAMKTTLYLQRLVPIIGVLLNRIRYPGLWTGLRVEIVSGGRMVYGRGVRLGEGTRIDLYPGSLLTIGSGVTVGRSAYFSLGAATRLRIGAGASIQDHCRLNGNVTVGRGCIFAPNVFVSSGTHLFDRVPHLPIGVQERIGETPDRPVRILDDCWLGVNAVVQPGVTVGRGCVIGANSVVTHDLPPYSVAAGCPARILRPRLQFLPKPRIDADRQEDLPYFYDGFAWDASAGDQIAEEEFVLAMDRPQARMVRLCLSGEGCITQGMQRRAIPAAASVIEFDLGTAEEALPFIKFGVTGQVRLRWAELA